MQNSKMTEIQAESIDAMLAEFWSTDDGRSAAERAEAFGIDLSLIEDNLRLTPQERLYRHDLALTQAETLVAAYERTYPNHSKTGGR